MALAATLTVIIFAWIVSSPFWYPFAAPVAIGGLPWALWRLARRRGAIRGAGAGGVGNGLRRSRWSPEDTWRNEP